MFAIQLRPYEPAFLPAFLEWRREPLTLRHNPLKEMSEDEIAGMLQKESSDLGRLGKCETFRWFFLIGGEVVGSASLKNISHSMGYGEIGYGVAQSHHGKSIGTAAIRMVVEKIFQETPLRRLLAYVHDQNQPSRRLLEKVGFQEEGMLREHYVINGTPVNEVLYGILRWEWGAKVPKTEPANAS